MSKFKLADGGTLFLDEIGDMNLGLQAKLLRALQEGEIEPLGSNELVPFDARVIAATSRDLSALVAEGTFREDLYYRLNVLPIRVPPLRERRTDIPALVDALCEDMVHRGTPPPELTEGALAGLGGVMWGLYQQNVTPQMGAQVNILIFIVIIIGGLGSTGGALIGALLVGLMANYTGFLAPKVALFSNIALMVAILLWRPQGIYAVTSR